MNLRFLGIFVCTEKTTYIVARTIIFLARGSDKLIWHEIITQVVTSLTIHAAVRQEAAVRTMTKTSFRNGPRENFLLP
jgi:hypothetical protein